MVYCTFSSYDIAPISCWSCITTGSWYITSDPKQSLPTRTVPVRFWGRSKEPDSMILVLYKWTMNFNCPQSASAGQNNMLNSFRDVPLPITPTRLNILLICPGPSVMLALVACLYRSTIYQLIFLMREQMYLHTWEWSIFLSLERSHWHHSYEVSLG